MGDVVNHPDHYTKSLNGIECIEAIEASMSDEEFKGYLKGNVLKYLWRYRKKNKPKEDLEKANWYLNKLISLLPGDPVQVTNVKKSPDDKKTIIDLEKGTVINL